MTLAAMLGGGGDELVCDFAQYYHVLNWRALPAALAATLAAGLPEGSRSMRRLSGLPAPLETLLLAALRDTLTVWVWAHGREASRGGTPPGGVADILLGKGRRREAGEKLRSFASGRDFDAAWRAATETR